MGIAFHCPQTMKFSTFVLLATAVTGTVASRPGSSLRFEHPGRVFSKSHSQGCCVQGVVHDEEPRGHLEEYSEHIVKYITLRTPSRQAPAHPSPMHLTTLQLGNMHSPAQKPSSCSTDPCAQQTHVRPPHKEKSQMSCCH